MSKMYQVMNAERGDLVMIAPLSTLHAVFGLHRDAVQRILSETDQPMGVSRVCFNGRPVPSADTVLITEFDAKRLS